MSNATDKDAFKDFYSGKSQWGGAKAPWDIDGPQQPFVDAAERIAGSILDAGCGTGENALFFASRGNKVTGIDFLELPIGRSKQKAAERGLKATFLVMDALALADLPEVFDNAIDCGLFHVFPDADRPRYVGGLASVIKPGGRLFLMCFSDEEPSGIGPRRIAKSELEAAFAKDWTIESIDARRFQIVAEYRPQFSEGGPKAWFATIRRN